jgi:hypothetical protein
LKSDPRLPAALNKAGVLAGGSDLGARPLVLLCQRSGDHSEANEKRTKHDRCPFVVDHHRSSLVIWGLILLPGRPATYNCPPHIAMIQPSFQCIVLSASDGLSEEFLWKWR